MRSISQGRWLRLFASICFVGFVGAAHGWANPEDEYKKLIRVNEDIQPLGEHPFGENISLYDGSLSFTQTDISLPGNGPTLQLIRHFEVYGNSPLYGVAEPVFGNWELEVPHLETLTAGVPPSPDNPTGVRMWDVSAAGNVQGINGWQTDNTAGTDGNPNASVNARCTNFTAPPSVVQHLGDPGLEFWDPEDWWKGYHLIVPGAAGEDILASADSATKGTYPAVTKGHWRFSCLPATANGQPGEGFLGHAPDGTLYWFDYLVYRSADGMSRQLYDGTASLLPSQSSMQRFANASVEGLISVLSGSSTAHAAPIKDSISRSLGVLLVTKIQDRFGNTLNYSYDTDGLLTGITASDGRALSVVYVPSTSRIQSVTLQPASGAPRTWVYTYGADGYSLIDVRLPDNSHWQFDITALQSTILRGGSAFSSCETLRVPGSLGPITGTITHPSGLVGQFTVQGMKHGRSYVPEACQGMQYGDPNTGGSYVVFPRAWYSLTTTQVTFSGAGIPTRTWSYNYSSPNDSWSTCTGTCPTTIWTDVIAPDGSTERNAFSNRFDITESQLQRTDYYAGAAGSSTLLRSEISSYAPPTTSPLPPVAGNSFLGSLNVAQVTKYSPLNQRVVAQDGDTYTWQAEAFNAYAQVTKTKRFSSTFSQCLPTSTQCIEEQTSYLNDTNLWVLGLPLTVTNVATGEVESSNTYNTSNDTLLTRARFGQTLMLYTFNGAGQLASFTDGGSTSDGNHHTTTLGNYKRGIPQTIGYPDGTSETLTVDDFGQISAVTDQAGHTTSYGYDSVGRITGISYPSGDEVAWLSKAFAYDFVTSAERGVSANHWRRTTTTGSAKAVTYFNAMLQPVLSDSAIGSVVQASTLATYDAKGQKVFSAYPSATALTFSLSPTVDGSTMTYDALGRVTQVAQDSELGTLTSSTAYLSGARQQVTDPKGNVTTTSYQVFDQPSYDAVIKVQAPAGITQTIARDLYGNPLSITQSGLYGTENNSVVKTLIYDSYHRLCRTTEPESGSTVMAYDSANNLAWSAQGLAITGTGCGQEQVAAVVQTARTYDAMNRVLTIAPPAGTQSTQYHYTPLGQPDSVVSGVSTWTGTYNFRGMLTGESLQLAGQSAWGIGYAHDAYGSLSLIHYPDGENVSYAPDALGRATRAGGYATGIGYFPNGQIAQFAYGNGTTYVAEQNARQLLRNFSYGAGSTVQLSEDLSYDANGNISTVADLAGGPRAKSFGYDALNRLTSANAAGLWGTQAYTYDALNNLRTLQTGSQTSTYHYDPSNKLASISNGATTLTSYLYDSRGNVTGENATTLVFDQKNQLTQIPGSGAYAYDASARRVSKTVGGVTTYYFYSQAGQLLYQVEPAANKATNFVYLSGKLLAKNARDTRILVPSEVNVTLSVVAAPSLSADGQQVSTTIDISNHGTETLTSSGPYPVHLGDHIVDASGHILVNDLDRVNIPDIAPGGHAAVTISAAASNIVGTGRRLEFLPVQEGVAWFDSFGTTPILVGPFATPSAPATSSNGSYTVSWAGIGGAASYNLQEQINGGGWSTIQSSSATSEALTGKANGTYGYRVQACGTGACGPWSIAASTTVLLPPPAPSSIIVPATSSGSIAVSWAASSTATSYTLQQRLNSGSWSSVYSGGATSTTRTVTATGSYTFQIQACNAGGCSAFRLSSAVTVTIPPASAPSLSVPSSSTTGSYTVSWTGVSGATSYTLQELVNGGGWSTIQTSSATSRAISGKGSGTYGYHAQACNAGGCGPWSGTSSISVLLIPATPTGLSATLYVTYDPDIRPPTRYSLAASWSAVATASSYNFKNCQQSGVCGTTTTTTTSIPEFYVGGATVSVTLQACNASGCSAWSAPVTPTTVNQ